MVLQKKNTQIIPKVIFACRKKSSPLKTTDIHKKNIKTAKESKALGFIILALNKQIIKAIDQRIMVIVEETTSWVKI